MSTRIIMNIYDLYMYPFVVIRVKDVFTRPTAWFFYPACQRALVFPFDDAKVRQRHKKKVLYKTYHKTYIRPYNADYLPIPSAFLFPYCVAAACPSVATSPPAGPCS